MAVIVNPETGEEKNYYVEPRLYKFLTKNVTEDLKKKDKDYPLLIDGYEGAGKSTFAQQIGAVVDPTLDLSRICMTANEFKKAIIYSKKNQCVIYDEAVTGLTAADSISRVGKLLKSLMMQMRQKNLFVIVILPFIFDLNRYTVLGRAKGLFHIYETSGRRGYWIGFNKKDMKKTFLQGKKTYSYTVKTRFKGRFYGKYVVDEAEYRKKKEQALMEVEGEEEVDKYEWRNKLFLIMNEEYGISLKKISESLQKCGLELKYTAISMAMKQYRRKYALKPEKVQLPSVKKYIFTG